MSEHYDNFLGDHYTWMFGEPFTALVEEQLDALGKGGVAPPAGTGVAVDLGCGSGFQSAALVRLGYPAVLAVDSSATLLAELEANTGGHPAIQTVHGDLREAAAALTTGTVEVAVCMGDTLTHLPDQGAVTRLFTDLYAAMAPGGQVVLSFRDLTTALTGDHRFILVHTDADTILTCFLEYQPDAVTVHDLLHQRGDQPAWTLTTSSYRKLRLAPDWVGEQLTAAGFRNVRRATAPRRMVLITATRQPGADQAEC